ncbi:MAG: hypothetical protein A2Y33_08045 [Spirochaetes bacterium GWF1_51_8]|nr:MAG: hypothetical protein A2Y33_08045 [Spirochaetes bacterium GWF1_51_8]
MGVLLLMLTVIVSIRLTLPHIDTSAVDGMLTATPPPSHALTAKGKPKMILTTVYAFLSIYFSLQIKQFIRRKTLLYERELVIIPST